MRIVVEVGKHAAEIMANPFWFYPVRDDAHAKEILGAFQTLGLRACVETPEEHHHVHTA